MASITDIQDEIVDTIQAVQGLTAQVAPFVGSVDDIFDKGAKAYNLPFVGVGFIGASINDNHGVCDNSEAEEHYLFNILVAARDNRGAGYAVDAAIALLDTVRSALIGCDLKLSGVAPLRVGSVSFAGATQEKNTAGFSVEFRTWQIIGG